MQASPKNKARGRPRRLPANLVRVVTTIPTEQADRLADAIKAKGLNSIAMYLRVAVANQLAADRIGIEQLRAAKFAEQQASSDG